MKQRDFSKCSFVEKYLVAYLADEVADSDKVAILKHLRNCPSCRQALANQVNLNRFLHQTLCPEVDSKYWERLWLRLKSTSGAILNDVNVTCSRRKQGGLFRWIFVTATAFAVAVATLFAVVLAKPVIAPVFAYHKVSYFTKLPTEPPLMVQKNTKQTFSLQLASLSMGNPIPSERAELWRSVEGN